MSTTFTLLSMSFSRLDRNRFKKPGYSPVPIFAQRGNFRTCAIVDSVMFMASPAAWGATLPAYSDSGDERFRFIVTGLERGEVLGVYDASVGRAEPEWELSGISHGCELPAVR